MQRKHWSSICAIHKCDAIAARISKESSVEDTKMLAVVSVNVAATYKREATPVKVMNDVPVEPTDRGSVATKNSFHCCSFGAALYRYITVTS